MIDKKPTQGIELVCVRDERVFGKDDRDRHSALWRQLQSSLEDVHELSDGYALSFPGTTETLLDLAELISLERRCCPFFTFNLHVPRGDEPITLSLTGESGVKQFLATELGLL